VLSIVDSLLEMLVSYVGERIQYPYETAVVVILFKVSCWYRAAWRQSRNGATGMISRKTDASSDGVHFKLSRRSNADRDWGDWGTERTEGLRVLQFHHDWHALEVVQFGVREMVFEYASPG